jgi:hypothetical protein
LCLFLAFFWSLSRSRLASSSEKGGSPSVEVEARQRENK